MCTADIYTSSRQTEEFKINLHGAIIVNDGEDALFTAESYKPDLILLDWMLPNMSGLEIFRQIISTKNIKKTTIK